MEKRNEKRRIETELEVKNYLYKLKYAIKSGFATVNFQKVRQVDKNRNIKYTNRYTISKLFPEEDEVEVLKRELSSLTVEEYIKTVKDLRFPKRSEMRVFSKQYSGDNVYIKIRVELISSEYAYGKDYILVMSFHFSEWDINKSDFPYGKG